MSKAVVLALLSAGLFCAMSKAQAVSAELQCQLQVPAAVHGTSVWYQMGYPFNLTANNLGLLPGSTLYQMAEQAFGLWQQGVSETTVMAQVSQRCASFSAAELNREYSFAQGRSMQKRTAAVTTVSLFLLLLLGLYQLASSRQYQLFGELIARVETEQPLIALTFDDGPSERYTAEVVELLARYQVPATFFVTGHELARHPEQGRLLVQAGHQLGNHSYTHKRMLLVSPAIVASEVERTDQQIRQAGFTDEILFRPPYGKKLFTLPWYLSQQQRKTIMWDLEPESEPKLAADPRAMAAAVIAKARPGSIILLHVMYQSRQSSREALPLIIEGLQAKGYRFVTVSELLQSRNLQ